MALIHGWAQDANVWDGWHDPLAEAGFATAACDLPGHRGSAEFAAPRGVDLARWAAQAITRDLGTLGLEGAHVVAYAEGCLVAAHLAVAEGVGRVALLDPAVEHPPEHASEAAGALRDPLARLWSQDASALVAQARTARDHDRRALADWLDQAWWPGAGRLRAITAPVLVAAGSEAPRSEAARKLAAVLHDGQLTTAPGVGDALLANRRLQATVIGFLAERAGAGS